MQMQMFVVQRSSDQHSRLDDALAAAPGALPWPQPGLVGLVGRIV